MPEKVVAARGTHFVYTGHFRPRKQKLWSYSTGRAAKADFWTWSGRRTRCKGPPGLEGMHGAWGGSRGGLSCLAFSTHDRAGEVKLPGGRKAPVPLFRRSVSTGLVCSSGIREECATCRELREQFAYIPPEGCPRRGPAPRISKISNSAVKIDPMMATLDRHRVDQLSPQKFFHSCNSLSARAGYPSAGHSRFNCTTCIHYYVYMYMQ